MRLAYLYSRYPVLSQTFCDTEMLALEKLGIPLLIGSIHSPLSSLRHAHAAQLQATVHYGPPQPIVRLWEEKARAEKRWPETLIARHDHQFGVDAKAALRARNAAYFAELFAAHQIQHVHVHFANRAAHTALFLKEIGKIPFSVTAHGQDFMADLGSDDLLREICYAAEFVAVETDYSRDLLCKRCPESAAKIHRVYNGMNLAQFPNPVPPLESTKVRILSVGRLVAFKGFEVLIEACARLRQRHVDFLCDIVGDGPLHESLQRKIDELELGNIVTLKGALPREEIMARLQGSDIFALASITDENGASDIFPTVITEAMAAARPVVSTTVAGIPEAVLDVETGILVPPGNPGRFAEALETFCRDRESRIRFGLAGRARVENHFQIERTIHPLLALFQERLPALGSTKHHAKIGSRRKIAYLIDRWPDRRLRSIEKEIVEVRRRNPELRTVVCDFVPSHRLTAEMKNLALHLEFLPDAMAIEAEWQANRTVALSLEEERANSRVRTPPDLFLRQARFAIALGRLLHDVSHVHATSSEALICGIFLKKILGVSLSASVEATPLLARDLIEDALQHVIAARIADRAMSKRLGGSFIFGLPGRQTVSQRLRYLGRAGRIDLTSRAGFWQEWATLLTQWSSQA